MAAQTVEQQVKEKAEQAFILNQKTDVEQLVDEYVEVCNRVESLKADPAFARFEELKAEVQSIANETFDAHVGGALDGTKGRKLIIGARAKKQTIDNIQQTFEKLHNVLGDKVFSVITLPLKHLDKYLTPDEKSSCVSVKQEGRRSVKSIG